VLLGLFIDLYVFLIVNDMNKHCMFLQLMNKHICVVLVVSLISYGYSLAVLTHILAIQILLNLILLVKDVSTHALHKNYNHCCLGWLKVLATTVATMSQHGDNSNDNVPMSLTGMVMGANILEVCWGDVIASMFKSPVTVQWLQRHGLHPATGLNHERHMMAMRRDHGHCETTQALRNRWVYMRSNDAWNGEIMRYKLCNVMVVNWPRGVKDQMIKNALLTLQPPCLLKGLPKEVTKNDIPGPGGTYLLTCEDEFSLLSLVMNLHHELCVFPDNQKGNHTNVRFNVLENWRPVSTNRDGNAEFNLVGARCDPWHQFSVFAYAMLRDKCPICPFERWVFEYGFASAKWPGHGGAFQGEQEWKTNDLEQRSGSAASSERRRYSPAEWELWHIQQDALQQQEADARALEIEEASLRQQQDLLLMRLRHVQERQEANRTMGRTMPTPGERDISVVNRWTDIEVGKGGQVQHHPKAPPPAPQAQAQASASAMRDPVPQVGIHDPGATTQSHAKPGPPSFQAQARDPAMHNPVHQLGTHDLAKAVQPLRPPSALAHDPGPHDHAHHPGFHDLGHVPKDGLHIRTQGSPFVPKAGEGNARKRPSSKIPRERQALHPLRIPPPPSYMPQPPTPREGQAESGWLEQPSSDKSMDQCSPESVLPTRFPHEWLVADTADKVSPDSSKASGAEIMASSAACGSAKPQDPCSSGSASVPMVAACASDSSKPKDQWSPGTEPVFASASASGSVSTSDHVHAPMVHAPVMPGIYKAPPAHLLLQPLSIHPEVRLTTPTRMMVAPPLSSKATSMSTVPMVSQLAHPSSPAHFGPSAQMDDVDHGDHAEPDSDVERLNPELHRQLSQVSLGGGGDQTPPLPLPVSPAPVSPSGTPDHGIATSPVPLDPPPVFAASSTSGDATPPPPPPSVPRTWAAFSTSGNATPPPPAPPTPRTWARCRIYVGEEFPEPVPPPTPDMESDLWS
jgi:hypothetical protein